MSWLSFLFEGAVSVLLLVMIAYCVKLNRLLGGLRERDAEIENLLVRFKEASDRAEASVGTLKAAGIEVERSVRTATERAWAARDELVSLLDRDTRQGPPAESARGRNAAPAPEDATGMEYADAGSGGVYPPEFFSARDTDGLTRLSDDTRDQTRSEAESDLLNVIRSARLGG